MRNQPDSPDSGRQIPTKENGPRCTGDRSKYQIGARYMKENTAGPAPLSAMTRTQVDGTQQVPITWALATTTVAPCAAWGDNNVTA